MEPPPPPDPNRKPRHDRILELYDAGILKRDKLRALAEQDELLRMKLDRAGIEY